MMLICLGSEYWTLALVNTALLSLAKVMLNEALTESSRWITHQSGVFPLPP